MLTVDCALQKLVEIKTGSEGQVYFLLLINVQALLHEFRIAVYCWHILFLP